MKNKITLYNHFHNGDIFFSRIIIKSLIDYYDVIFHHNLHGGLLNDISGLEEIRGIPNFDIHGTDIKGLKINTWIGQKNMIYVNTKNPGCSFDNYFNLSLDILNDLGLKIIEDKESLLPTIDYGKLVIPENITNLFNNNSFRKVVLVSNGDVHSGQSLNFNFEPIIEYLSVNNNDVLFLVTQKTQFTKNNVICTSDLTKTSPDLLLISFISTFCDIIVGRASGPYCYTQTKENLLSDNKTFIAFCHNINEGKFYDGLKSKFVWSNNYDFNNILNIINNEINN